MNKELQKLLLTQQEEQSYHLPMEAEYSFYRRIANGDMELLKLNMNADTMEGMGKLSSSPLQNKKYHLVITVPDCLIMSCRSSPTLTAISQNRSGYRMSPMQ